MDAKSSYKIPRLKGSLKTLPVIEKKYTRERSERLSQKEYVHHSKKS